jgi:hypothetical protein
MRQVYKGRDTRIDLAVAIKVLGTDAIRFLDADGRFERDARALAKLNHPRICTLFEFTRLNGTALLVMEHLEGQPMSAGLEPGRLPLDEALRLGVEIADGLAVALGRNGAAADRCRSEHALLRCRVSRSSKVGPTRPARADGSGALDSTLFTVRACRMARRVEVGRSGPTNRRRLRS